MAELKGAARSQYVQAMFTRIAPRYDLMNRLMTFGQDIRWRQEVISRAALPPAGHILDLGAGTGDLAMEAWRQHPDCHPVAADFTLEMMRVGQGRPAGDMMRWVGADTLALPFPARSFDAVVSGFLMRNVVDLPGALREQHRVLKEAGRIVILDTTRPPGGFLGAAVRFHSQIVIPFLGQWVAGHREAYTYLPQSTAGFLHAEELAAQLVTAGFREVGFVRRMLGAVSIHWGVK